MATWPATVPAPGYAHDGAYASGMATPDEVLNPERIRRLPDITERVEWPALSATEMAAFKTFYDTTTNGGTGWFSASWLATVCTGGLFARFAGVYESAPRGLHWRVGAALEVMR